MILVGLLTRLAAVPMIVDMLGALLITKLPSSWTTLLLGEHGWGDFLHETRLDLAQLCGSLFLLLAGAGRLFPGRLPDAQRPYGGAVKKWPGAGSNRRPSAFQADGIATDLRFI